MTTYFDEKASELRDMIAAGMTPHHDEVRRWVRLLTLDMAVACEFERTGPLALPDEIRDAIYTAILRRSPEAWPCGVKGYGVDYEFDEQGMRLLAEMVEDLHDLFHSAARAGWPGQDNPRSAFVAMDGRMEERCAEIIAANPSLDLSTKEEPR